MVRAFAVAGGDRKADDVDSYDNEGPTTKLDAGRKRVLVLFLTIVRVVAKKGRRVKSQQRSRQVSEGLAEVLLR